MGKREAEKVVPDDPEIFCSWALQYSSISSDMQGPPNGEGTVPVGAQQTSRQVGQKGVSRGDKRDTDKNVKRGSKRNAQHRRQVKKQRARQGCGEA